MGLLDQFKRAMGLETRSNSHDGLRATISFPAPQRAKGNGTHGSTNGRPVDQAAPGRAASNSAPAVPVNGPRKKTAAAIIASDPASPDETQAIPTAGLETRVELPVAPPAVPAGPVEVVSLQFGLDDASMYEFEDEDEAAELLEDGNCRRCWIEDHLEVLVVADQHSGLRICPECKATYRAADSA